MQTVNLKHYNNAVTTLLVAGIDSELAKPVIDFGYRQNWKIIGTTRRSMSNVQNSKIDFLYECDFSSGESIKACTSLISTNNIQDNLFCVFSIGTLDPIGKLGDVDFDSWKHSFYTNFLGQLHFVRELVANRKSHEDFFLTYAGNGTNSAPTHFSAYTLSKIALIKSMEILAAEYPWKTFISLGVGWMNSKIHNSTLTSNLAPEEIVLETKRRISTNDFANSELILDFLYTLQNYKPELLNGRNFSLQGDDWKSAAFWMGLDENFDYNKLRRFQKS